MTTKAFIFFGFFPKKFLYQLEIWICFENHTTLVQIPPSHSLKEVCKKKRKNPKFFATHNMKSGHH